MKFTVITLFPEMVESFAAHGLLSQARDRGQVSVETLNPRRFTSDVHHTVDDRVYGGSDGMVMKVEPLARAIEFLRGQGPLKVVVLSPQGRRWDQRQAGDWANAGGHVALV
ncbi:MAG: tRNA (guanosine(37)-N1)-methyltransferase TrmD, partial [Calothrix sp. SM1_5_4]|nr:tRNA (guanosine(37)-N1)-methyltransferase TrmD [Calothrix sp. SM1_5_4]